MGDPHYLKGWHATATVGHFGAAAGTARLLGLDAETTAYAFGIAGTQAAGLKANFGTMCKPLHAGKAAMNGLMAAEWAKRGFDSRPNIVERDNGFAKNFDGICDEDAALDGLGDDFHLSNLLFKYHAACYGVHSPVECAKRISANPAYDADKVEKIEVHHASRLKGMCDQAKPATGLEIKFSLYMTTALALAG
ncbi:MAG TPA: MmgE/PrpD family protein, partial [Rhodospirillaceae bacterium]|nr:MmgE/PrpD family protein [Rhodospirillaceae bacterium]